MLAALNTAAVIAFAWFLAWSIAEAVGGASVDSLAPLVAGLAGAVVARGLLVWATDAAAAAASAKVKAQLRTSAMTALAASPARVRERGTSSLTTLLGGGLDALDGYFGKYVPQLIATAITTPIMVVVIFVSDPLSGVIVAVTLPLIPIFMVLIGLATRGVADRQWVTLQRLSGAFLDVVGGLGTLMIFGRQHRQRARMAAVGDDYRASTMKVLRVTFLSGFVLEFGASIAIALVAVEIGLRLLGALDGGALTLGIGLFVLLLAPEAFLPVRAVGAQFHAAADGLAAASDVLEIIEGGTDAAAPVAPAPAPRSTAREPRADALEVDSLTVERAGASILDGVSMSFPAGAITALTGRSGSGKTTLVRAITGLTPSTGVIELDGRALTRGDIAWAGQEPQLYAASVAENIAIGSVAPDAALVRWALDAAGAEDLEPASVLGVGGVGLSGGQAQRVAIARALYRMRELDCPVLLLDEPTSALDAGTEQRLMSALREQADAGRIVIVVSHRPEVVAAADLRIELEAMAYV